MRINIVGGGPAGLYFAYLMKRSNPAYEVRLIEQNAADVTFGFGVVLSARALKFIAQGDEAVVKRLMSRMESWDNQHIVHRGTRVVIDGSSYLAISRLALLEELQVICRDCGVELIFSERFRGNTDNQSCDVLVGADGANSVIRDEHADVFGPRVTDLQNYFAWYGVKYPYEAHTLTFRSNADGVFCGHHYRYTSTMSTFVAEVDADTWHRSGMETMNEDERREYTERVYSDTLHANPLISNKSNWRRWRLIKSDRWSHANMVLIGDALRSAHPSIGSGTRLAMEDAVTLWRAFQIEGTDVAAAFVRYERERRPVRDKLNRAAELSIAWYEDMATKMSLSPYELAYNYMLRTNIITPERLAVECGAFMAKYRENRLKATFENTYG
jgi:2-polyprenyl-6-methoxyphenol hydroxylase-like FAD-dependent oxidoreductase